MAVHRGDRRWSVLQSELNAAPGLSTDTLLTVTVGWNGELPPGKMLSMIPLFSTNLPPPTRTTVFG